MPDAPLPLTPRPDGVALAVKVVPGASRQRIAGRYGGGIKVTVTKQPVAGAANAAVIAVLAEALQVPLSQIRISRGHTNPRKEVIISGLAPEAIRQRLLATEK